MSKNELIMSAYGSHNATIAMYYRGEYTVVEVERWLNKKNAGLLSYLPAGYPQLVFDEITDYLLSKTDRSDVDVFLGNYFDFKKIKPKFNIHKHLNFDHHESHAACAFFQSPYQEAIVFTYDGGGDRGFFNVYKVDRYNGVELLERCNQDLGFAYMILADHLKDIRRDPLNIGNLVYAGKLMGLCSYGNVREEWLPYFNESYETFNYFGDSYIGGAEAKVDALPKLMKQIGVDDFDQKKTRLEGQFAWDIAATTQRAFEDQFFKFARPFLDKYPDMPVCLAGGCALNVLLNGKLLQERGGKVFVPPNTNDCGVAVGGILHYQKPENQVDLTYSGIPLLDEHMFSSYIEGDQFTLVREVSPTSLADFIKQGNIVGLIQGTSEHGPRALGNRSIICNPVGDMKNILNEKVKNREWYRPFAPVVRLEDAPTFFNFPEDAQSRHMTFVAEVKDEWKDVIPAITHEDGTARLQTVTSQQNPFLYELLTEFSKENDHAVLLNTSFNVNSKPILSRLSDALHILKNTQLDAIYYEGDLIFREGDERKYKESIVSENIKPLDETTTRYLIMFPKNTEEYEEKYIPLLKKIVKDRKTVVITTSGFKQSLMRNFPKIICEVVDEKLFYHEFITENAKIPANPKAMAPYIKLLWIKAIMKLNHCRTKYHLFIDVDKFVRNETNYDIARDIELLSEFAKDDDKIVISAKKYDPENHLFDREELKRRFGKEPSTRNIIPAIFCGNIENIEWLSVNYEGMLLQFMRDRGIVGIDEDYLMITFMTHPSRFKVLDI